MMEHKGVNEEVIELIKIFFLKLPIAVNVMFIVVVVGILKYLSHIYGFEVMELNYLFPSLVAGVVFLMSFIILGVFADYKESERKMSELSSTLRSLLDDICAVHKHKNSDTARQIIQSQIPFIISLYEWFYAQKKEWVKVTKSCMDKIRSMNELFVSLDKEGVPTDYIIKMKTKLDTIRDIILRMDTIRRTKFIGPAYGIIVIMCVGVSFGLIITEIQTFPISFFFTITITFFIFFMLLLVKDLENPFEYYIKGEGGTEISLGFIHEFKENAIELIEKSIGTNNDPEFAKLIKRLKDPAEFAEFIKNLKCPEFAELFAEFIKQHILK